MSRVLGRGVAALIAAVPPPPEPTKPQPRVTRARNHRPRIKFHLTHSSLKLRILLHLCHRVVGAERAVSEVVVGDPEPARAYLDMLRIEGNPPRWWYGEGWDCTEKGCGVTGLLMAWRRRRGQR